MADGSDVNIVAADGRRAMKRFIDFGYRHYETDRYFVPPLRRDVAKSLNPAKNAFFGHGKIQPFLALDRRGEVVGRIAAIVNGEHLKKHQDATGFFGFVEFVDDLNVSRALLDAATQWLRSNGLVAVRGPTNPSMNDTSGLLVGGFDRYPAILMPYNKPYYAQHLEAYGMARAMTMWAYYVHKKFVVTDKLERGAKIVQHRNPDITLRTLDMKRFDEDARAVLEIYNDAWHDNWGHVPMTAQEFAQLAKDLKRIVDPRIVYLLEDKGTPVAFSISLPDINVAMRKVGDGRLFPLGLLRLLLTAHFCGISECRTPLQGIRREYQGRGLDVLLNHAILSRFPDLGYIGLEMSWVLDSNHKLRNAVTAYGGAVDKEYAMYEYRFS